MRLVVLCTANRCRSPMAAALLRPRLSRAGVDGDVLSAGFEPGGLPALDSTVEVMLEVGVDLRPHRSRLVTPEDLAASDLTIGMTRQHSMEAVLLNPSSWPRTFPLVDLLRRGARTGARGADETVPQWVARVHAGRQRADLLALRQGDDISDPAGHPAAVVRRTRDRLSSLVEEFVHLIAAAPARA